MIFTAHHDNKVLLARTYYESQNKPTYVIREVRQTSELAAVDG